MLKKMLFMALMCSSMVSQAHLVTLDPQELTETVGQGGADLNWTLSLNHLYATNMNLTTLTGEVNGIATVFYQLDKEACGTGRLFCRLAISPNNHVVKEGEGANAKEYKKWLVFKDIQGTFQIDRFSLDGTTVISNNRPQTAMKITFYDEHPLKIRNFGFSTLAVETGSTVDGELQEGYLNTSRYDTYEEVVTDKNGVTRRATKNVPLFDKGQEKGFMGMNVHGNLHMSGNLKIFSFNCTGSAQSRC